MDYLRGVSGFYVGLRIAWHDIRQEKEAAREWKENMRNLSLLFPGSTGARLRGGVEGFVSDSFEGLGAATPQLLLTATTGIGGAPSALGRTMLGVNFTAGGLTSYGQNAADIDGRIESLRKKAALLKDLYPETAKDLEAQAQHLQDYGAYYAGTKALVDAGLDLVLPEELLASKPLRGGYSRRLAEAFGRNTLEEGLSIGADQIVNAWAFGDDIDPGQGLYDLAVSQASQSPMTAASNLRGRPEDAMPPQPAVEGAGQPNQKPGATSAPLPPETPEQVAAREAHQAKYDAEEKTPKDRLEQLQGIFPDRTSPADQEILQDIATHYDPHAMGPNQPLSMETQARLRMGMDVPGLGGSTTSTQGLPPTKAEPDNTAQPPVIPREPRKITRHAQYGSPHPITGTAPVAPPLERFNSSGIALSQQQIQVSIIKMREEGHADDRHGSQVTEGQLDLRAMHGIDPMTQTKQDGVKGTEHKYNKHATQFTSDRALAQARHAVEASQEFISQAGSGATVIVIDSVSLESALGGNYLDHVRGKSRVGSKNNPTGTVTTDLTGGHLKAVFERIDNTNQYRLITIYPNPQ